MTRDEVLAAFEREVANLAPILDQEVVWPSACLRLRTYPASAPCPDSLATSVRAVIFRGNAVVVVRQHDGRRHVQPGGGREPGETMEETLRRELAEECGWRVGDLKPLGVHHFHRTTPAPKGSRFQWTDFLQPLFVVEGVAYDRRAIRRAGEIEAGSSLVPIPRALAMLPDFERGLLQAALTIR